MFTIKNVTRPPHGGPTAGVVWLWEAKDVNIAWNDISDCVNLNFTTVDGGTGSLDTGLVYVMNANGKTVDTVYLKDSNHL